MPMPMPMPSLTAGPRPGPGGERPRMSDIDVSAAAAPLAAAPFLREIGRGKDGSRALPRERARELMSAILDGRVSDLALGGILLALRMKGEQASEIAGFLDALEGRLTRAPAAAPAWVVIPSYNGARKFANLVPLLALLLARSGIPVLVHGQASEPPTGARARVSSADIFHAMGIDACATMADATQRAAAGLPAMVPLSVFAPALSRLIGLRAALGVRNVAHTLAKLVRPVDGPSLLVSSYTHPDFGRMQAELFGMTGEHALTMRGTDGEAVISAQRAQGIDHWRGGRCTAVVPAQSLDRAPLPLPEPDARSTAEWTQAVLEGRTPVPEAIAVQLAAIRTALA